MDFQRLLAGHGICVHYDVDDLDQDVQRDRGWLRLLPESPLHRPAKIDYVWPLLRHLLSYSLHERFR
jgi:hypothetical protein